MPDRQEPLPPRTTAKIQKAVLPVALALALLAAFNQAKRARTALEEEQNLRVEQTRFTKQITEMQEDLAGKNDRLTELLAENSRLKSKSDETELLKLRGEVTRLRPLQEDVVALQKMLQQSSGGLPTWKTKELANVGSANPMDALQTYLYNAHQTNVAGIQNSFVGDNVDPPDIEAFQKFVNDRNNYSMDGVPSFRILSENWLAPNKVQMEVNAAISSGGVGMSVPFTLLNVNGEWKIVVFNFRGTDGKVNDVGFFNRN